jgi:hypothetical protein
LTKKLTPVTLPPGRARLSTTPKLDRVAAHRENQRGLSRE